jgi:Flagellar filament outer layer protein Flaa.
MKQHINRALLFAVALSALSGTALLFADESTVNLESKVIQDFSKTEAQNWFVIGSKFKTGDFPHIGYVKGGPTALLGDKSTSDAAKSLGIAMLFDRKEYNWVDIVPGTKDKPVELDMPGRVKMIDMWVWSGNFNYYLEAFVRDFRGVVYTIPMGDLNYIGWKNLRINIPESIPQSQKYLPRREGLQLVKFRIWTRPTEVVVTPGMENAKDVDKAVKFYFYNIKVLTDTFESLFDGDALTNPDAYSDALGSGSGSGSDAKK